MKLMIYLIALLLFTTISSAQKHDFARVDSYAMSVGYYDCHDTLAAVLTRPFDNDLDKVRSIFRWITQHIDYDCEKYHKPNVQDRIVTQHLKKHSLLYRVIHFRDNRYYMYTRALPTHYDRIEPILQKKKGICGDYSALFVALCNDVGIKAAYISGDVPDHKYRGFHTEKHAWNAVFVNNEWHLIDVTWASGYTDEKVTRYTPKFNEFYFFTNPELMRWDHYTSYGWQLSKDIAGYDTISNLLPTSFGHADNNVIDVRPFTGTINTRMGDTVKIEVDVADTTQPIFIYAEPLEEAIIYKTTSVNTPVNIPKPTGNLQGMVKPGYGKPGFDKKDPLGRASLPRMSLSALKDFVPADGVEQRGGYHITFYYVVVSANTEKIMLRQGWTTLVSYRLNIN